MACDDATIDRGTDGIDRLGERVRVEDRALDQAQSDPIKDIEVDLAARPVTDSVDKSSR